MCVFCALSPTPLLEVRYFTPVVLVALIRGPKVRHACLHAICVDDMSNFMLFPVSVHDAKLHTSHFDIFFGQCNDHVRVSLQDV